MTGPATGLLAGSAVLALAALRRPMRARTARRGGAPPAPVMPTVALLLLAVALVTPLTAAGGIVVLVVRERHLVRREGRRTRRALAHALPDAVDLLLLCTSAGQSIPIAHPLVADLVPDPLGLALRSAATAADRGRPRAEALLSSLAALGDRAPALGHVLADHLRYGTPIAPALERLGAELRLDRRRRGEEEARRVPVRLLGPLVSCVLPAFALLTVVPLLAASLRALPT